MSIEKIDIPDFIALSKLYPLLDVRSPSEYAHAHIPGAISLPLFSDEERKVVGTAYKQQSKEQAIKIGLQYFGPKMVQLVEAVEAISQPIIQDINTPKAPIAIILHCWRGGMRSAGMAWLLSLYGFKVYTLIGGYKSYRNWVHQQFSLPYSLLVLGGFTGSGKTVLLHRLAEAGQQVIDIEGLANHKGSAFGKIGMPDQPSQEMFENLLATALFTKHLFPEGATPTDATESEATIDCKPAIWVEDESQRIGGLMLPDTFWKQLRSNPIFFLDIPFEERLDYLVLDYAKGQLEEFVNAIIRIQKRLGGLEAKNAIQYLMEGNVKEAYRILLTYYDKWYTKGLYSRANIQDLLTTLPFDGVLQAHQTEMLITTASQKKAAPESGTATIFEENND